MLLSELVNKCNENYGDNTCVFGSGVRPHSSRLPTGIFSLDWALCGGLPFNQMVCFKGPESGGKTTTAMNTSAVVSSICWKCKKVNCECSSGPTKMKTVWLDVEGAFDKEWATAIGMKEEDYVVIVADDMEQYSEIAVSAVHAEDVGLVVIDSIAALVPSKVTEGTQYDNYMGVAPRAIKQLVMRINSALIKEGRSGHEVVVILTNQVMMDIRNMFKPEDMPGGKALKHFTSLWVKFNKKALTETEKKYKDDSRMMQMVQRHSFIVERLKVTVLAGGGEFVRCREPIRESDGVIKYHKGELLEYNTVMKQAKEYGLLKQSGSKWKILEASGSQKEIVDIWRRMPDVYRRTQEAIITKAMEAILNA